MSVEDIDFARFFVYDEGSETNISDDHIVTFNLGGTIMQTMLSTVLYSPIVVPAMADSEFMARHWDEERQEYFFDRDARPFRVILNYLRTGTIHLPSNICSTNITAEFKFWGIADNKIESCCWKDYSYSVQNLNKLRKLEHDRRPMYMFPEDRKLSTFVEAPKTFYGKMKEFVYSIVSIDKSANWQARVYSCISFGFVIMSVIIISMETVKYNEDIHDFVLTVTGRAYVTPRPTMDEYIDSYMHLWYVLDQTVVAFFSFEMAITLLSCPSKRKLFKDKLFLLDIAVLVPDYISIFLHHFSSEQTDSRQTLGLTDIMRSVRLLRIFRMLRRIPGMYIILFTLQTSIRELVVILGILCCATFFFSSLIYYFGNQQHQGDGNNFDSIPVGCWWAVTTLATVGYGDMTPVTLPGRIIGSACAVTGALLLGLTIPTLIKNFLSMYFNIKYMMYKEAEYIRRRVAVSSRRNALDISDKVEPLSFPMTDNSEENTTDQSTTEEEDQTDVDETESIRRVSSIKSRHNSIY